MNVVKLFKDLGGADAILQGLRANGHQITAKGIEKWRERKAVPMARWMQLVELAKPRRLTLSRYMIKETPK